MQINPDLVAATMRGYDRNNLFRSISAVIGGDETKRLFELYRVGTSKHWPGATVFWQISSQGDVRGGKIMLYDALTGHRVKNPHPHISWVHSVLRIPDFTLRQCFFGEHLLPYIRDRPVAIVESEKTAIIASHYLPQYLWLATGGKGGCLNRKSIPALQGREVLLVSDLNATDDWREKLSLFSQLGIRATVFDQLDHMASDVEKAKGLDIADYLIAEQTPQGVFEQMMQQNPMLRELVKAFDMELVSITNVSPDESPQNLK